MKRTLLFVLALAVIPVEVNAQVTRLEQMHADAEAGDADAQFFFGGYYEHGMGGAVDHIESEHWYRLAAEQGHADAQQAVGYKYSTGWGIPTDEVEGVRWYRLAAEQGHWLGSAPPCKHVLGWDGCTSGLCPCLYVVQSRRSQRTTATGMVGGGAGLPGQSRSSDDA